MFALIRRIFSYKFFPVCWTLLVIILLCLPGSMVPSTGIFTIPNLDKIVHIFLFGTNTLLWGWHYKQLYPASHQLRQIILLDVILTVALGIALEYVQGSGLISHRTFEVNDMIADAIGASIAGIWLLWRVERPA